MLPSARVGPSRLSSLEEGLPPISAILALRPFPRGAGINTLIYVKRLRKSLSVGR